MCKKWEIGWTSRNLVEQIWTRRKLGGTTSSNSMLCWEWGLLLRLFSEVRAHGTEHLTRIPLKMGVQLATILKKNKTIVRIKVTKPVTLTTTVAKRLLLTRYNVTEIRSDTGILSWDHPIVAPLPISTGRESTNSTSLYTKLDLRLRF